MKLSEAIRNWKSNITTHMAVEYVLTLRANINAFSDAAQSLEDDNAKLRELVRRYVEYTSQDRCEGCVFKSRCNDSEVDECWQLTEIRGLARELGIEVKE